MCVGVGVWWEVGSVCGVFGCVSGVCVGGGVCVCGVGWVEWGGGWGGGVWVVWVEWVCGRV